MRKKIFLVLGTRPEAIKMAPLIMLMKKDDSMNAIICHTGQHRELVEDVLRIFDIQCDYNCNVMEESQSLSGLAEKLMFSLKNILFHEQPDLVVVHGDTTTAFISALVASYMSIPIAHVEAGLRTNDVKNPYPEEINRRFIDMVSEYLFVPTRIAYENLIREGYCRSKVIITGNTAIDAMQSLIEPEFRHPILDKINGRRLILCTMHRRELITEKLIKMLRMIKKIAIETDSDTIFIFSLHPEPKRAALIKEILGNVDNIILTNALNPYIFQNLLNLSYLIVTDSGGIQEEAGYLGKPLLLVREVTERPECLGKNMLLVGLEGNNLYAMLNELLINATMYNELCMKTDEYGVGGAAKKILDFLKAHI